MRQGVLQMPCRLYRDFKYKTLKSWSRKRPVVGKAEILDRGNNPRFIVTNLPADEWDRSTLYEDFYCARGDMENRIKEQQLDLFADRTSTHWLASNQLRLWFLGLCSPDALAVACGSLERHGFGPGDSWKLSGSNCLKSPGASGSGCRRIHLELSSAYPYRDTFAQGLGKPSGLAHIASWPHLLTWTCIAVLTNSEGL